MLVLGHRWTNLSTEGVFTSAQAGLLTSGYVSSDSFPDPHRNQWLMSWDATASGPSTGYSGGTAADLHCLPYSSAAA